MIVRNLFLKISFTVIVNFSYLDFITNQQFNFKGLKESIINKLVKMIDSEILNFGCQLSAKYIF